MSSMIFTLRAELNMVLSNGIKKIPVCQYQQTGYDKRTKERKQVYLFFFFPHLNGINQLINSYHYSILLY